MACAVGLAAGIFVDRVRGDAVFRDLVHLVRADLNFEGLAGMNHGRVQGLIQIGPRHRDVVLKTPGDGPPELVHCAERAVTIARGIRDDADGEQIVDLAEGAALALRFEVD